MKRAVPYLVTAIVATAIAGYMAYGGRSKKPSIYLRSGWLVVENPTKMDWIDVKVTVNAYYRGVSPKLSAGGRLEAPLGGFVAGLGQRFNPARETVRRVEVRATTSAGRPVAVDWDGEK